MKTLLSIYCGLLLITPNSSAEVKGKAGVEDLVFFTPERPIFIRMHLEINNKSHRESWDDFLEYLLKTFDTNNDGKLDLTEAKSLPAPASTANRLAYFSGAIYGKDVDEDGQVSLKELKIYYQRYGSTAFRVRLGQAQRTGRVIYYPGRVNETVTASKINKSIFRLLDRDNNGLLSIKEMQTAETALLKQDFNDDEMWTAQELQGIAEVSPSTQTRVLPNISGVLPSSNEKSIGSYEHIKNLQSYESLAKRLMKIYSTTKKGESATHLTRNELGIKPTLFKKLDQDNDGKLNADELTKFCLRKPDVELQISVGKSSSVHLQHLNKHLTKSTRKDSPIVNVGTTDLEFNAPNKNRSQRIVTARQFLDYSGITKEQFKRFDRDNNGYLSRAEANSIGYGGVFASIDKDKDGKIFYKELNTYIKQSQELRSRSQNACVSLNISEDNEGVFGLFDVNGDNRLSVREVRNISSLLKKLDRDSNGQLSFNELPRRLYFNFEKGPPMTSTRSVGAVAFSTGGRPSQPLPPVAKNAPVWFQKMDRNRDGDISPREFLGKPDIFAKMDTDKDRLLSIQEAKKANKLFQKKSE